MATIVSYAVRYAAGAAALSFALAVCGFGAALPGYAQALHPVALLGAQGMAHAGAFNALGFVLPGLLAAAVAWRLRQGMADAAPWPARIGARLALLSALAFAAQGLLPLDPRDLEAAASRAHATAWLLWWVAFAPAALLLALGLRHDRRRRPLAWAGIAAAAIVAGMALLPELPSPGIAQRSAFAAWFAWWLLAARSTQATAR